jgi:hypothetical protein
MKFADAPIIPTPPLFRAARVSSDAGMRILAELEQQGDVRPERTPTGRVMLTPRDGRRVYDAIRGPATDSRPGFRWGR